MPSDQARNGTESLAMILQALIRKVGAVEARQAKQEEAQKELLAEIKGFKNGMLSAAKVLGAIATVVAVIGATKGC